MHCQREMDGMKAEGEKLSRRENERESWRVKPFRCAMMERQRQSGQMKGDRLMWETEGQIESKHGRPER